MRGFLPDGVGPVVWIDGRPVDDALLVMDEGALGITACADRHVGQARNAVSTLWIDRRGGFLHHLFCDFITFLPK